jgi:uncharacterized membrane protein YdbT with pleckstrin-like domain
MSYIKKTSTAGENIVAKFKFTKLEYLWKAINPITWLLLFLPLPILWFRRWCFDMGVTNKRLVVKSGFIARNTGEIRLEAIESICIDNTILGRIFGYGTLRVTGRGNANVAIPGIANIIGVKRMVEAAKDEAVIR